MLGLRISVPVWKYDPGKALRRSRLAGQVCSLRYPNFSLATGLLMMPRSGKDKFILKDNPRDIYDNFTVDIRPRL